MVLRQVNRVRRRHGEVRRQGEEDDMRTLCGLWRNWVAGALVLFSWLSGCQQRSFRQPGKRSFAKETGPNWRQSGRDGSDAYCGDESLCCCCCCCLGCRCCCSGNIKVELGGEGEEEEEKKGTRRGRRGSFILLHLGRTSARANLL